MIVFSIVVIVIVVTIDIFVVITSVIIMAVVVVAIILDVVMIAIIAVIMMVITSIVRILATIVVGMVVAIMVATIVVVNVISIKHFATGSGFFVAHLSHRLFYPYLAGMKVRTLTKYALSHIDAGQGQLFEASLLKSFLDYVWRQQPPQLACPNDAAGAPDRALLLRTCCAVDSAEQEHMMIRAREDKKPGVS
ncbi:hypothetical protein AK812_SmicGene30525 [Symbiodinium microadriaticum]|uniref:Uncharacterized protein n=1 Tax=Symbiodinium microadriaticum TaxID=2951 RepID=A0A1Q9CZ37_SYMMI|nr:hypothetical protein AK812_SmicGene30525 [Symbiodinium microadriaticum]